MSEHITVIESVKLDDANDAIILLDQTKLPNKKEYLHLKTVDDVWDAIYQLKVRGAPAIGIAAAYGIYIVTKNSKATNFASFSQEFKVAKEKLASSRPTAVNLFWALDRMEARLNSEMNSPVTTIKQALKEEANTIKEEDQKVCEAIGRHALEVLEPGWGILTHCNAGTIATAKFGTALAPIYLGQEQGYNFKVYADETRPLLQGARLTAWELKEAGVDVTLICDNMASIVMSQNKVQAVLVGCDRVAANGDAANKIGTSGVAILAKHYGIPFYVCAPMSTIDLNTETGADIEIELRSEEEIKTKWYSEPMAPADVKTYNPAFDVTDHSLITGIITEKGIISPSYKENLAKIFE